jgi:hypothetical protein
MMDKHMQPTVVVRFAAGVAALIMILPGHLEAQVLESSSQQRPRLEIRLPKELRAPAAGRARVGDSRVQTVSSSPTAGAGPSPLKRVLWGVVGGVGGFFGGGTLGYKIDRLGRTCGCDDPGLKGLVIGALIGAPTGAILLSIFPP